jgi:hypothetical protein
VKCIVEGRLLLKCGLNQNLYLVKLSVEIILEKSFLEGDFSNFVNVIWSVIS